MKEAIGESIRDKLATRIQQTLDDSEVQLDGALITAITRFLEREGIRSLASRDDAPEESAKVKEQAERAAKSLRKLA